MELPSIKMKTSTIEGVGVGGEIDSPTIGQFESLEAKLKFNTLYSSATDLMNPLNTVNLTLRAAQQVYDKTGGYAFKGLRIVMGGRVKEFNPGTVKKGDAMDAETTLELTYQPDFASGQTMHFVVRRDVDEVQLGAVPTTPAEVGSVVDL